MGGVKCRYSEKVLSYIFHPEILICKWLCFHAEGKSYLSIVLDKLYSDKLVSTLQNIFRTRFLFFIFYYEQYNILTP
jgi:hypothetical protein